MGDVNLGSSTNSTEPSKKEKMIYMNLPTTLVIMNLLITTDDMGKQIVNALKNNISSSFSNREIRKAAFLAYGVKTANKLKKIKSIEYDSLTEIFGEEMWGVV